ncbi:alkanesulfonate monooxygenase SsuD/methylene tetrahydromethanopterin reductase-like flavin-dependent oxidoreductase (luciferase family) [Isoptericola jiangsuensis]|uniref:Alkanesulfonate monooxygenase SsuD/methylene tetrahydromethanopterin reductase-like flavin-dependent oxidoreductase (Luciferase family) n=1 Tax=Isoptericola jiangsuensis TaxID=548579 RepID=A0A2A9F011_9MICO|nr:LLM class flavin-dependent oxidoreductase [Isoptericola jiangsuensis]PFG43805.1 alkanesulfonate monooxygenase SsuD/methylene tetrahydromethanopterin reductase-like flavin-dependent oxidoreductase (luciferase family) [Isoptericola jiangsuensis]
MRFGFIGSFGSPAQHVRLARECEEHGWDGFFTWDGVSLDEPGFDVATWDPFALLAAVAAVTERITLGAMVFAPPRRRPWELAQQVLTVDHLSGGRLVLPVGMGVPSDRAFSSVAGQPASLRDRARALDEVLDWMERSWSGEVFEHDGEWAATGPFRFPEPPVHGRVPVWPVGVWDAQSPPRRSLDRALRWDGMVVQVRGGETPEDAEPGTDDLRSLSAWIAEHRSPDAGPFDIVHQGRLDADPDVAREQAAEAAAAGATWWMESWWDPSTTPESLLDRVRQGPPTL